MIDASESTHRRFSFVDRCCIDIAETIHILFGEPKASRPMPTPPADEAKTSPLSQTQSQESGALMRINEVGEICAQALYRSQRLTTQDPQTKQWLTEACQEELDHLVWCRQRLDALNASPSLLNPLWYLGAYGLGLIAGLAPKPYALGFIIATEEQVEKHLNGHRQRLPHQDRQSHAVISQMALDEANHAQSAKTKGGKQLPYCITMIMQLMSKIMINVAYYV